jgi:peptide deformylase
MSLSILYVGDPLLREPAKEVTKDDLKGILECIPEMEKLMEDAGGIALAANQVGILKRFFIMGLPNQLTSIVINPEILDIGDKTPSLEGCLSIPGANAEVKRAKMVKIRYRDHNFNEKEETFEGIAAVAIQHEIDHLDGKLYIDHIAPMRKALVMKQHNVFISKNRRGK